VQKAFEPFSSQPPSTLTAEVRPAAASEPAPASVSPQAPIFSPRASGVTQRRRCSGEPNL